MDPQVIDLHQKPRVFIASSAEGSPVAGQVRLGIDDEADATVWHEGLSDLSPDNLETLLQASRDFDFAVLVLTPDDLNRRMGWQQDIRRDNILFTTGLFMGALGRRRTHVIYWGNEGLEARAELSGLTTAVCRRRADGNLEKELEPVCTQIKNRIRHVTGVIDAPSPFKEARQHTARRRRRRSIGTAFLVGPKKKHRIVNISTTGALLETDGEMAIGQCFDLDLALGDAITVRVSAKVVRVQYPDWELPGGVGIEFTSFEENAQAILEDWVDGDPIAY
jgi:hypothetical protein